MLKWLVAVVIVLLAAFIAVPIAWYGAHTWLEGYQYRTGLSWWIFGLTGSASYRSMASSIISVDGSPMIPITTAIVRYS